MKAFEIVLLSAQFVLFVIILSNMARLVSDYLISKFK